jgi:hypothetical protein
MLQPGWRDTVGRYLVDDTVSDADILVGEPGRLGSALNLDPPRDGGE